MQKNLIIMFIKNFFLVLLMFFSINAYAKNTWIIEDIKFQGLQHFSRKKALKNIFFTVGSKISKYNVRDSIHSLFKTGKFEDIKVIYLKNTIIFKLKERPIISSVFITGNNSIKNVILDKYLIRLGIKKGNSFNPFFTDVFAKDLENFYHDNGKYTSKVEVLKIPSINNTVNLKVVINEGISTKLNNIKIFGNKNFSEEKIISLFKLKNHKSWWNLFENCIYSSQVLKNDLKNLSSFYLNQGYFYFNIDKKQVNFFKEKNNVNIIINIFEGQKYRISHFFVNGNLLNYYKTILDIINISDYELYRQDKINFIVNKIKRLLSERGYIKAQVTVNPEIDHRKKTIILNFNIDIQKRYFVRKINFRGNGLTQDLVLRREMKQIEGDYFNIKKVEEGKKRLEKTRYFDRVQIMYTIIPYGLNQIDITYQVQEKPTGSINFGIGYGIESGLSFNAAFSQNNLFGSGNSLKVSAIKNKNQKYSDISINYPYFISKGIGLNTRLFYNDKKYNLNNVSTFVKDTYGFEGNLAFLVNDVNTINIGLGYTHNGIINSEKKESAIFLKEPILDFTVPESSLLNDYTLNYSWMHNSLKYLYYFPISGNQTYISGKNTIPGSDNSFYKTVLDSEEYIPLNQEKTFIFLSHIHMGIGNSFNKKKLPFYENFFVNSSSNIRGFQANTIGPKTIYNNSDLKHCIKTKSNSSCESTDSIGGNTAIIANLEIITPIPMINKKYSKFLRPSFFLDIGNIWNTNINDIENISLLKFSKFNNLKKVYSSFGISLQWFSPIGPLVFSYAYPIQKNNNHQLESFQFNFGKNW